MVKEKRFKSLIQMNEKEENKQDHRKGDTAVVSLLDLSHSILVEILSRLPKEAIFCCRRVCKRLSNIISEPLLLNRCLDKLFSSSTLLIVNGDSTFELLNFSADDDHSKKVVKAKRCEVTFDLPKLGQMRVIDSCNGFICLSHSYSDINTESLFIVNPILGERISLPIPKRGKRIIVSAYAFGFGPRSQQYKVLNIINEVFLTRPNEERGEICSLGIDCTWKPVGGYMPFPDDGRFVTVGGAFHWLACNPKERDCVYSFDIDEEKVQQISLPAPLHGVHGWMTLGVLTDNLCAVKSSSHAPSTVVDIWMMNLPGISWTKHHTLQLDYPVHFPARVWKNKEVVVWRSLYCPLRSYSLLTDAYIEVRVSNHRCALEAVTYFPCLFSLKDVMTGNHYCRAKIDCQRQNCVQYSKARRTYLLILK